MFDKFDLDLSLDKSAYDAMIDGLRERLGVLQRELRDKKIPVIMIFEGWRFSGISNTINRLTYALDPRGYRVHPTQQPDEIDRAHPMLWRFWVNTPLQGQIAIFDRSWYTDSLIKYSDTRKKSPLFPQALSDIITMEEQLADDGAIIMKFFLHVSKKEQKKRLKKFQDLHKEYSENDSRAPKRMRDYDAMLPVLEAMISSTSNVKAPWTIVEGNDRRYAIVKVYETIISRMEGVLKNRMPLALKKPAKISRNATKAQGVERSILETLDLNKSLPEEEYASRLVTCEQRLHELQYTLHRRKIPVTILFEGCDAAGKGGAIIRIDRALNPRCSVVEPIAAPTPDEKSHHYLWRFIRSLPKAGDITIFDRTWYGRVLVERVEGFCTEEEWQRAYREINALEDYLVRSGGVLIKFWLQIDLDTQLKRFKEREADTLKQYKITEEDWRNRKKWAAYRTATDEMLEKTSTPPVPWTLVESNDKYFARIKIMETIVAALEDAVARTGKKRG